MEKIRISVRELVEFILRSGDIDNRHGSLADKEAMQLGSRLHRKLQSQMGKTYQAEIPLKTETECRGFILQTEGRTDGIFIDTPAGEGKIVFLSDPDNSSKPDAGSELKPDSEFRQKTEPETVQEFDSEPKPRLKEEKTEEEYGFWYELTDKVTFIDEIKGVFRDLKYLAEPVPVHLAQAKCYAAIFAMRQGLDLIGVQMTYANLDTEEIKRFRLLYRQNELKCWFEGLVSEYEKWAVFQLGWRKKRQESIAVTVFPYAFREGQKELAAAVYRTIKRKKKLFLQASTGVGKTIATVFPAVKAMGEGCGDRIFYLTAKTITRTVAQEAFSLLEEKGLQFKVITLTAKEKICCCEEPDCNPEKCPRARGHFDRVNDALYEMLTGNGQQYTREEILEFAGKWQVCPFEFSLDLSLWMDAIICDYNYVFDPQAKLKRFFAEGVRGDNIFLIDEAHNLVERGREMFSASLIKEEILEIRRLMKPYSRSAARSLDKCNQYLLEKKRECQTWRLLPEINGLMPSLLNTASAMEKMLEDREHELNRPNLTQEQMLVRKKILDFYFQLRSFLSVQEEMEEGYEIYTELMPDGGFLLKLFCVDPAGKIGECLDRGCGSILFSATLLPIRYYMGLLSGKEEDYAVYAKSSFPEKNRLVLTASDVSTRYSRRNESEYRKIAEYIVQTIDSMKGNYMVFFPSYRMMEDVREQFERLPGIRERLACGGKAPNKNVCSRTDLLILSQKPGMTEDEREEYLAYFRNPTYGTEMWKPDSSDSSPVNEDAQNQRIRKEDDNRSADIDTNCETYRKRFKASEEETGKETVEEAGEATGETTEKEKKSTVVGFCVMGGIFGEGIDLKGDALIGAVIVGAGLPQVCSEREILKEYYDGRCMDGFSYAYQYPGMNKVLQSAGRVIRTEEDRGVILLLDERFRQNLYRGAFPAEWSDVRPCTLGSVSGILKDFWMQEG